MAAAAAAGERGELRAARGDRLGWAGQNRQPCAGHPRAEGALRCRSAGPSPCALTEVRRGGRGVAVSPPCPRILLTAVSGPAPLSEGNRSRTGRALLVPSQSCRSRAGL